MSSKQLIWGGMFIGSFIGGLIPYAWNGDFFAFSLWGAIGGLVGIWGGYKLAKTSGSL
jgi:hypothetical protein